MMPAMGVLIAGRREYCHDVAIFHVHKKLLASSRQKGFSYPMSIDGTPGTGWVRWWCQHALPQPAHPHP